MARQVLTNALRWLRAECPDRRECGKIYRGFIEVDPGGRGHKGIDKTRQKGNAKMINRQLSKTVCLFAGVLLFCLSLLPVSCGKKSALVGSWRLLKSEDPTYTPGIIFEFNANGTLKLLPGDAPLSDEDKEMFANLHARFALAYQAGANGDLRLTLDKADGGSAILRMKYTIEGNRLSIRDENDVSLIFERQP